MNFYPIYRNKKLLPWIKYWLIKGNKVAPKHLSEWINSASAITLTGVYKGSPLLYLSLKGNTSQTGTPTPEAPVPVNVVKGNNTITINGESYRVNLGDIELCKIGDYQDVIYKDNNKWYVEKKVGKVVLNGSEYWIKRTDIPGLTNTSCFRSSYNDSVNANAMQNTPQLLDRFVCLNNPTDTEHARYTGASNYRFQIFINKSRLSTDDNTGIKNWLAENNTTVYYVLATSTTTEITETNLVTQLEAIYNARLQSGTNTITQTPSDLPFYLNFRYYEKG